MKKNGVGNEIKSNQWRKGVNKSKIIKRRKEDTIWIKNVGFSLNYRGPKVNLTDTDIKHKWEEKFVESVCSDLEENFWRIDFKVDSVRSGGNFIPQSFDVGHSVFTRSGQKHLFAKQLYVGTHK